MGKKILIVDDESINLAILKGSLEREGYFVNAASNGDEAVELMRKDPADLVLLDVLMPGKDGFETCREIRNFSEVPVIFLTAKSEEKDKVKGLDGGADDYIIKPFSSEEMLARVRAALRRSKGAFVNAHERYFIHGKLKIDHARAEIWDGDEQVFLSATEYRLLLIFSQNIGKVVSTEELLSQIWGEEYKNEKEILWVSIARLRQKVESNSHKPVHIMTKSGIGYYMPVLSTETGLPLKLANGGK